MKKFEVVVMSVLTLLFVGTLLHNGQSTKTPESWEKDVKQFGTTVTAKKEKKQTPTQDEINSVLAGINVEELAGIAPAAGGDDAADTEDEQTPVSVTDEDTSEDEEEDTPATPADEEQTEE